MHRRQSGGGGGWGSGGIEGAGPEAQTDVNLYSGIESAMDVEEEVVIVAQDGTGSHVLNREPSIAASDISGNGRPTNNKKKQNWR